MRRNSWREIANWQIQMLKNVQKFQSVPGRPKVQKENTIRRAARDIPEQMSGHRRSGLVVA